MGYFESKVAHYRGALYAQERYDEKVRNLFFAGFRGDTASLDKGMKVTEDTLAVEPKHAEALVWHGAGAFFRAGMAFQKGDATNGAVLWRQGLEEMREAVGLAPDNLGVRIPRGAVLLTASHNVPPNMSKPLIEAGLTDFEHAYKLQERIFHTLGTHPRGELMIGMASAYDRLGQKEKARRRGCRPRRPRVRTNSMNRRSSDGVIGDAPGMYESARTQTRTDFTERHAFRPVVQARTRSSVPLMPYPSAIVAPSFLRRIQTHGVLHLVAGIACDGRNTLRAFA